MCKCTPNKRTPFCGAPGCEWPPQIGAYEVQARVNEFEIEAVARKLAGQYQVDDGYGEESRGSAEAGEMWRNFKAAAIVAIAALDEARSR